MTLSSTFFTIETDGPVAHLIMSRPDRANAMSPDFWEDLPRLMRELSMDTKIRAVVVSGAGRHFTGGMDLDSFKPLMALTQEEPGRASIALRESIKVLQDSFSAMEESRLPVICAIQGACLGGGIDFITAADIRLATRDAYFGIEEIQIGMAADVGTLQRLPDRPDARLNSMGD